MKFTQDPVFIPFTLFLIFQVWFFWNTGRNEKYHELARTTSDPEVMKKLLKDRSWFVRSGLSLNPQVPEDILESLSEDKDPFVRKLSSEKLKDVRHWDKFLKSLG
jgi:hypothetical protein